MKEQQTNHVKQHLEILGHKVRDKVTGFTGIVASVSFDLYGCVQVIVQPPAGDKGTIPDSRWFDANRLEVQSSAPVMEPPNFDFGPVAEGKHGPAEKPAASRF